MVNHLKLANNIGGEGNPLVCVAMHERAVVTTEGTVDVEVEVEALLHEFLSEADDGVEGIHLTPGSGSQHPDHCQHRDLLLQALLQSGS